MMKLNKQTGRGCRVDAEDYGRLRCRDGVCFLLTAGRTALVTMRELRVALDVEVGPELVMNCRPPDPVPRRFIVPRRTLGCAASVPGRM